MADMDAPIDPHAAALHARAVVIDACAPILRDAEHARHWIAGGCTAALATVCLFDDDRASTVANIARLNRQIRARDDVVLARDAAGIAAAKRAGKLAVVLAFQSSGGLGGDVGMVEVYHQLGVKVMNLAYNKAELTADGCTEPRNAGLTGIGRRVIAEMERVGMLLDLSHTGYRSSMEAMEMATRPVAFTHSNAWSLFDHPRNIRDEQIRACVATGGVIGINGHPAFIRAGTAMPAMDDLLAHLDHILALAGIEHVGIGLDFSQPPGQQMTASRYAQLLADGIFTRETLPPPPIRYPVGDAGQMPRLTEALLRRGWSDEDVLKLLGGNFLRLFRTVWGG
jgi:membrane dipeptidase